MKTVLRTALFAATCLLLVLALPVFLEPPAASAAASPTGQIAIAGSGGIFIMDAHGGRVRSLVHMSGPGTSSPTWAPNGKALAFIANWSDSGWRGDLEVVGSGGGVPRTLPVKVPQMTTSQWAIQDASWSPKADTIAVVFDFVPPNRSLESTPDSLILLVDPNSGRTRILAGPFRSKGFDFITWTPDGSTVVAAAASDSSALNGGLLDSTGIDVATGTVTTPWPAATGAYVAFSPDGQRTAFVAKDHLMISNTDGSDARSIVNAVCPAAPSWSPDGHWVACLTGRVPGNHVLIVGADGRRWLIAGGGTSDWEDVAWQPSPAPSPSPSATTAQASCYGADYGSGQVNTTASPQTVAGVLRTTGFAAGVHLNDSPGAALGRLTTDSVFYYNGHGNWNNISFVFPKGAARSMLYAGAPGVAPAPSVGLQYAQFPDLAAVVLNACLCGKDADKQGNILKAFTDDGAHCAIGFSVEVPASAADIFGPDLFHYACAEDYEVGAAAYKAAADTQENSLFCWAGGISPDTVVVKRASPQETVYIDRCPPVVLSNGLPTY